MGIGVPHGLEAGSESVGNVWLKPRVGKHNERAYLLSAPRFSPYRNGQDQADRSLRAFPVSPRFLKLTRMGSCRIPLRLWFWCDLEIETKLLSWRDQKPQSPLFAMASDPMLRRSLRNSRCNPHVVEQQACSDYDRAIANRAR